MSLQNSTPYARLPTDAPTRASFFLVHKWRISKETRLVILRLLPEISTRRSMSKSGTGKDYLLHYLRSPAKSTFKGLCKQTPLWLVVMRKEPQEPWRTRRPQERDVEQSAPTHAHHTHCASRQPGTTADRRYEVPRDWIQEACQMAGVLWGTCCKGFCARKVRTIKLNKVHGTSWNAIKCKEHLRSCPEAVVRQATINLYSRVWKSLGDFFPKLYCVDLAEAYVTQESVSLRIYVRRKGVTHNCPMDVRMRKVWQKAERGKNAGTNSCTRFPRASYFKKTRHVCQKYGGACTTWYSESQRYKNGMRNWIPMQPRKIVSSDVAKILEKESSDKD